MPLKFQPKARTVVMCDFRTGFVPPEMVKNRPVVVIASHKRNSKLVTVVPLSTTRPEKMDDHHHEMRTPPLPDQPHTACWAKCDMVYTVSTNRLDRYRVGNKYFSLKIDETDFAAIRMAVAAGLNLPHNRK